MGGGRKAEGRECGMLKDECGNSFKSFPQRDGETDLLMVQPKRIGGWGIWVTIAWSLLLVFLLPGVQILPLELRILLTLITVATLYPVVRSIRGWKHFLTLPLWFVLLLVFLNYAIWTFPNWTHADWARWAHERFEKGNRKAQVLNPEP